MKNNIVSEAAKDLGTIHVIHHPTKGYRQKGGGYSKEINRKTKTFKSHDTAAKSDNVAVHRQHYTDKKTGKEMTSFHPSTNRGTRVHTVNTATGKVTKGDYLHHHQAKAAEKMGKKGANSQHFPTRVGKTHADDIPKSKKFDHATQKGHYVEDIDMESSLFYADYISKTTFDPKTNSVRSKVEEAATKDYKKNQHTKTPKMEVEPTEIPEKKELEKEELHGDQHKLDHNKDMKITASDMKMVRKKGAVKNHPAEAEEKPAPVIIRSKKPVSNLRRSAASRPMGVREDEQEIEEATFRVSVSGLPTMHITGSSAGEIKTSLRKMLKDPKAVGEIEKITPSEKKSDLRAKMSEDQAAIDAYLKKGGKITKVPAGKAQGAHGDSKMASGIAGQLSTADTSRFKTKKKVKSMEDVEQVDEISKNAKAAYTRVAARDVGYQATKAERGVANNDREAVVAADRKRINRLRGIDRATKGMQKEGAMKRIATQDAEKERLGPKVKGSGLDTFKKKPANEEKDTHVTKDGRTVKKGLWYYMNKRKKAGTSRPASAGTVSPEAMKKSQS